MKWKKIIKYFLIIWILLTILFVILAQRDLKKMYGGHTQLVDTEQFNPTAGPFAISNVNVLSPDGQSFTPNQTVLIDGSQITNIDSIASPEGRYSIIDGSGQFLIPGLVDAHVHLFKSPNDLLLYVANGVTQIRELIGSNDILQWREEIQNGRLGPHMYVATPRLGTFGTVEGWFMSWSQMFDNIENADAAHKAVDQYSKQGYDAIKIYSHLSKESYDALCAAAKEKDMDILGHVPWSISISNVINSGQSDIAHLEEIMNAFRREQHYGLEDDPQEFLDYADRRSREIGPELAKNNISVTTTLWLVESFVRQKFELDNILKEVALEYQNPGISEWVGYVPQGLGWLPDVNRYKLPDNMNDHDLNLQKVFWSTYAEACRVILKNLSDSGVQIQAGTDANLPPTVPGFSLHQELESMVNAGMSNAEVLQSATRNPAQWLNNNSGIVEIGRDANLVLLDKNPLEDIRNTTSINSVILNGKLLERNMLDQILEAVKTANNHSRKKDIGEYLEE